MLELVKNADAKCRAVGRCGLWKLPHELAL